MKFAKFFLLISVLSILNLEGRIPCTYTKLHENGTNVELCDIALSSNDRFVAGISTEGWLHVWDLYSGGNAILNWDIAFDDPATTLMDSVIYDIPGSGTVLIATKTTHYLDENHSTVISKIKIIKYNYRTKEITHSFYEYQNVGGILGFDIYDYTLSIATPQGYLHQIDLVTKQEQVTYLFENIPNAIGYEVQFLKDENLIIIAVKYNDLHKSQTVHFWHNNLLINSENIPKGYDFSGCFSEGSFFLKHQSGLGAKIYNSFAKSSYTVLHSNEIMISCCGVTNDRIGAILYKQENQAFLKLINNQTKEYISFELPDSIIFMGGIVTDDNMSLKIFLHDKSNFETFVLEINLFKAFNYVKNRETIRSDKSMEMLTGDYQITYNPNIDVFDHDSNTFEVTKSHWEAEPDTRPTKLLFD